MKNFIVQKHNIPVDIFNDLDNLVNNLINNFKDKSLVFTDEQLKKENPDIYNKLKDFYNKKDAYFTIRVSTSDNNLNNQFHYDGHKKTIVIPLKFLNFTENNNGDLILSSKIRNSDSFIFYLLKKILKQNIIYRYFSLKFNLENFTKVNCDVGDEVVFNGFYTYHGNTIIDPGKTRVSLIVHYDEFFSESKLLKFIKKIRHSKYKLNV